MEDDLGAARRAIGGFDGELALSITDPTDAGIGWVAGLTAVYLELICDHVGGVEADAELTDEVRTIGRGCLFDLIEKSLGARAGDCAQILDDGSPAHANTVVTDGEAPAFCIWDEVDFEVFVVFEQAFAIEGVEAEFVDGIACVTD